MNPQDEIGFEAARAYVKRIESEREALLLRVAQLEAVLRKPNIWQHRCSDGVGGCAAISESALHAAMKDAKP